MAEETVFIAPGAIVKGNVTLEEDCSVWYNAVVRADSDTVTIGKGSNIQDGAVIHVDASWPVTIGSHVTIGHGAIVHGAKVEDGALIGMGAILMNGSSVGKGSIVAAGALVPEGKAIPEGVLAMGVPAKVVRSLSAEEIQKNLENAAHYVKRSRTEKSLLTS